MEELCYLFPGMISSIIQNSLPSSISCVPLVTKSDQIRFCTLSSPSPLSSLRWDVHLLKCLIFNSTFFVTSYASTINRLQLVKPKRVYLSYSHHAYPPSRQAQFSPAKNPSEASYYWPDITHLTHCHLLWTLQWPWTMPSVYTFGIFADVLSWLG